MRIIDTHVHITEGYDNPDGPSTEEAAIAAADRFGIDTLVCMVMTPKPATPELFRRANDRTIACMERWGDRIWGWAYVNPGYCREALAEIERCRQFPNFVGIKLFDDYTLTNPVNFPLIERCIELGWGIVNNQARVATDLLSWPSHRTHAGHIAEVSRRYPEAKLIGDHIGGGGDWEWACKTYGEAPTVHLEISGSVYDEGMMELALRTVGVDRLLFATDSSIASSVGKLRALAHLLPEHELEKIASGNFLRLVGRTT
jgi:predicted TIM-barrel fold metal-dependent hydrolase